MPLIPKLSPRVFNSVPNGSPVGGGGGGRELLKCEKDTEGVSYLPHDNLPFLVSSYGP